MSTPVLMHRAADGSLWPTQLEAEKREALIAACEAASAPLGSRVKDEGCRFANGHGYIQHTRDAYESAKKALIDAARKEYPTNEALALPYEQIHVNGIVGRILSDSDGPLWGYWSRLACIDARFREWGQPYYTSHPEHAEQFEVTR